MGARLRPIPAHLWQRLARLDQRCDFLLERRSVKPWGCGQGVKLYTREWRVTVSERGDNGRGPVVCIAATLAQALEGAVQMAEAAGWANPGS